MRRRKKTTSSSLSFAFDDVDEKQFAFSLLSLSLLSTAQPTTRRNSPDLLLLLLGQAARAGGSSRGPGGALGRLASGRGDGAAVGGLLGLGF